MENGDGHPRTLSSVAEADSSGGLMFISSSQLTFGDTIAEGRFAVIRKAQLTQGNETIHVASKGLKREFAGVVYSILKHLSSSFIHFIHSFIVSE